MTLHSRIKARYEGVDEDGEPIVRRVETTPGRMLLSEILPQNRAISFDLINRLLGKKEISDLIDQVYRHCGQKETVIFCDRLMALGFQQACKAGISFGKDDLIIPEAKHQLVAEVQEKVKEYEQQYQDGLITQREKYNKEVDAWTSCSEKVAEEMIKVIRTPKPGEPINSVWMMSDSGARGSAAQIKQLAGMRGLMTKPSGEIIATPIISNFKEGLTVLEYFNSTHGARKGLADTALKTANSGYLTRRLVDVAQDAIITEEDCGTTRGLLTRAVVDGGEIISPLADRIIGRCAAVDVLDPLSGAVVLPAGALIDEDAVDAIERAGIDAVSIRSVLTCETHTGVCGKCYGRDLARGTVVNIGEAVGVIAAQSIGEPGTQLTMRTFHIGGAAQRGAEQSSIEAAFDAKVEVKNRNVVINSSGLPVVMGRNCEMVLVDEAGREKARHRVPYGARLLADEGAPGPPRRPPRRMGSVHDPDHHREGRHRALRRSDRGCLDARGGRRGDRHLLEGRDRLEAAAARRRSAAARHAARRSGRAPDARQRAGGALLPAGRCDPVDRQRRRGQGRRRAGADPAGILQDARHHRRSAAGGRAVRGAQAQGFRDHQRIRGARRIRQGLQDQAAHRRGADPKARASRTSI